MTSKNFFSLQGRKYQRIFTMHWENALAYPVSFTLWRFRQLLTTLTALTLWTVIFQGKQDAFGYSQTSMVSYIFLTSFLQSIILSTFLNGLANDIYSGNISKVFVQPLKPMWLFITQELADKSMNLSFAIGEAVLLYLIFHPVFLLPALSTLILFFGATFLGAVLLFYIMLLLGSVGFWSQDTWGPRFLLYMFLDFTAGKLYPLNVLPQTVQRILSWTPFPYLSYVQSQIFLQKLTPAQTTQSVVILLLWIAVLAVIFHKVWNKGLRDYGAMGR